MRPRARPRGLLRQPWPHAPRRRARVIGARGLADETGPRRDETEAIMAAPLVVLLARAGERQRRDDRQRRDAFGMSDEEFRRQFRLPKDTVRWLCGELEESLGPQRLSGVDTLTKVLCALRFFATGSFQQCVGNEEAPSPAATARFSALP